MLETISLTSPHYPIRLSRIHNPPPTLSYRGCIPSDNRPTLCIVGSRTASSYAHDVLSIILESLKGTSTIIISGLARGVDTIAHTLALSQNLTCIGLPGSSISEKDIHPRASVELCHTILDQGGCLMSEYPEGTKASRWTFPARNRIMAGLADVVLVIEATERSGTLITALHALNSNREVLSVPGPITSETSRGTNRLILQGARIVCSPDDVREALGFDRLPQKLPLLFSSPSVPQSNTSPYPDIIEYLTEPRTHDEIILNLSLHPSDLLQKITELEIEGYISVRNGKIYRIR